jgi:hypothetical protein
MPWLSVVIPVRNEAAGIVQVLMSLQAMRGELDIIVVDGGSTDGTLERVGPLADHAITSLPGRAVQMNAGAAQASGEVLLFLHADTQLPAGFVGMIRQAMHNPAVLNPTMDPRVREDDVVEENGALGTGTALPQHPVIPAHAGTHFDLGGEPAEPANTMHNPAVSNPTMGPRVREDDVLGEREDGVVGGIKDGVVGEHGVLTTAATAPKNSVPDTVLPQHPVIPAHAGTHFDLPTQPQWGRFDVELAPSSPTLKLIAWMMNHRSRLTGICTGDQAIFVRHDLFNQLGGYADIALMEDIEFTSRLKRIGPAACIPQPLTTSSRRWQQHGVLRTVALMWWLRLQYWVGVSPTRLAKKYYPARPKTH